jgi:hypothetical protein
MQSVDGNGTSAEFTGGFENIDGMQIYYERAGHGSHNVLCTSGALG